jgi:hypothetical protein
MLLYQFQTEAGEIVETDFVYIHKRFYAQPPLSYFFSPPASFLVR